MSNFRIFEVRSPRTIEFNINDTFQPIKKLTNLIKELSSVCKIYLHSKLMKFKTFLVKTHNCSIIANEFFTQPVILHLLDIPQCQEKLAGVVMELEDLALSLLRG